MSDFITNAELRIEAERLCDENERLQAENAKLRDAMYTKAGKHALHHMDEDELRIWATQQAEHIEELRELCGAMLRYIMPSDKRYTLKESMAIVDDFAGRCEELGIEVPHD